MEMSYACVVICTVVFLIFNQNHKHILNGVNEYFVSMTEITTRRIKGLVCLTT